MRSNKLRREDCHVESMVEEGRAVVVELSEVQYLNLHAKTQGRITVAEYMKRVALASKETA